MVIKLHGDTHFQRAFPACSCIFKVITLVVRNKSNYFENKTACSKCALKASVATQLKTVKHYIFKTFNRSLICYILQECLMAYMLKAKAGLYLEVLGILKHKLKN